MTGERAGAHHRHCEERKRRSNPMCQSFLDCFASLAMTPLPEANMAKAAFDKIKAGIEDVRAYVGRSVDKSESPVSTLTDAKVRRTSAEAPPTEEGP